MKKQVLKFVSGLILLVFFVGIAPKEYLHELFFAHHDTVHPIYKKGEIVITKKHHHCAFLSFEFAPYIVSEKQFISFKEVQCFNAQYLFPQYYFQYSAEHIDITLRGPPSIHALPC